VAGTPTRPLPGVAVIRLVGDRTSPYVTIESDTGNRAHRVSAGPKVLLALGKVSLHGIPSLTTWTRLAATAAAGSNTATLAVDVDWKAGDVVVLASSSHNPDEAETVTLLTVSGPVLTFTTALKHAHYGGAVQVDSIKNPS